MFKFTRWTESYDVDSEIHIKPVGVVAVEETVRRRAYCGLCRVAIITFIDGSKVCVLDSNRKAAQLLASE